MITNAFFVLPMVGKTRTVSTAIAQSCRSFSCNDKELASAQISVYHNLEPLSCTTL